MISQDELKRQLNYNQVTGIFTWAVNKNRVRIGQISAQVPNSWGYLDISIYGHKYRAHRLAWLYVYGSMPEGEIDHINRIKTDNRIENLRLAANIENARNKSIPSTNKSGAKGVSWKSANRKWCAQIRVNGRPKHLGLFESIEEASKAYEQVAQAIHGDFYYRALNAVGVAQ